MTAEGNCSIFELFIFFICIWYVNDEAVVCQLYAVGEAQGCFDCGAYAMAHVSEVCDAGFYFGDNVEGLLKVHVAVVLFEAEGVYDECVNPADEFEG